MNRHYVMDEDGMTWHSMIHYSDERRFRMMDDGFSLRSALFLPVLFRWMCSLSQVYLTQS